MASEYRDWEKFVDSTTALVDRFRTSVDLDGHEVVNDIANKKTKQKVLEYCIPNQKAAQSIRDTWSSNRRAIPRKGMIFPDGSILTIYIRAKTRVDRLKKVFSKGHFDELLMDMTFEDIQDFREKYFAENKSQWQHFKHKTNYEEFEKRFLT